MRDQYEDEWDNPVYRPGVFRNVELVLAFFAGLALSPLVVMLILVLS